LDAINLNHSYFNISNIIFEMIDTCILLKLVFIYQSSKYILNNIRCNKRFDEVRCRKNISNLRLVRQNQENPRHLEGLLIRPLLGHQWVPLDHLDQQHHLNQYYRAPLPDLKTLYHLQSNDGKNII